MGQQLGPIKSGGRKILLVFGFTVMRPILLNPSKLPYLDHYGLVEIKKIALEIIIFEIPLIQV